MKMEYYGIFLMYFSNINMMSKGEQLEKSHYRAAVIELSPIRNRKDLPRKILETNSNKYASIISLIKTLDDYLPEIVIFPENGLTTLEAINRKHDLESYSIEIPEPKQQHSLCKDHPTNMNPVLVDISCLAENYKIYIVINLIEQVPSASGDSFIFYNTNVVFDRTGSIIAKYRKKNVLEETQYQPGNEIGTFKTDFGVTFGMIIGSEILQQTVTEFVNKGITDIIYTSSWQSQYPYLFGLSLQSGYSTANKVNLLASNYNLFNQGFGGSGIYFANGTAAQIGIQTKNDQFIIKDIPIQQSSRKTENNFAVCDSDVKIINRNSIDTNLFKYSVEDISNYTHSSLTKGSLITRKTVCHKSFCCEFFIEFATETIKNNEFKLVVFHGKRNDTIKDLYFSTCSLLLLASDNNEQVLVTFKNITIKTNSVKFISMTNSFVHLPIDLETSLMPGGDYKYCFSNNQENEIIMYTTKERNAILNFGIYLSYGIKTGNNSNIELITDNKEMSSDYSLQNNGKENFKFDAFFLLFLRFIFI